MLDWNLRSCEWGLGESQGGFGGGAVAAPTPLHDIWNVANPLGHEWSLECPRPGCEQWGVEAWHRVSAGRLWRNERSLFAVLTFHQNGAFGCHTFLSIKSTIYLITARHRARHAQLSCKSVAHVHNKLIQPWPGYWAIESWKFCTAFTALECSFGDRFRNHRIHSLVGICITSHFDSLVTL